jgi:hypothetical protein
MDDGINPVTAADSWKVVKRADSPRARTQVGPHATIVLQGQPPTGAGRRAS